MSLQYAQTARGNLNHISKPNHKPARGRGALQLLSLLRHEFFSSLPPLLSPSLRSSLSFSISKFISYDKKRERKKAVTVIHTGTKRTEWKKKTKNKRIYAGAGTLICQNKKWRRSEGGDADQVWGIDYDRRGKGREREKEKTLFLVLPKWISRLICSGWCWRSRPNSLR